MEELIFFGVIILFSILESIARSRKARKAGDADPEEALPDLRREAEWEPQRSRGVPDLPTYDDDPSYDDEADAGASESPRRGAPTPMRTRGSAAETMLPAELLEELAALAGRAEAGRAEARRSREQEPERARTVEIPREPPPLPGADEWRRRHGVPTRIPTRAPVPLPTEAVEQRPDHVIHQSHRGYGTDPSERAPSREGRVNPLAESISEDAAAVRRQLKSHSASALRRAWILQDVLGPPAALREDHLEH